VLRRAAVKNRAPRSGRRWSERGGFDLDLELQAPREDFITNDTTGLGTTSTSNVAVPGMTKTISVGGTGTSCVLVDVSAFAFAASGELEYVSVTLDGATGNPVEVQFAGDTKGVWAEAHSALFAFPSVRAGSHTVAMVFRSLGGNQVFLHRPAMEITHK
jgi:hypothetical protein